MTKPPHDTFRLHGGDDDRSRADLDDIFQAGARARRHGTPLHDNPYAAGSDERDEWDAGWSATADCDEEGEADTSL